MSKPNILLLILDSVRAKNVGAYGYHRETTPFLSEYATRASLYQQARSPGIHSVASHASLWTGTHVEGHQIVQHEDEIKPNTTIWEELSKEGYETGIFTTNPVVAHASNLSEQFDKRVTDEFVDTERKLFSDAHGPADVAKHEGVIGNLKRCLHDEHPTHAFLNNVHHFVLQQRSGFTESVESSEVVKAFQQWRTNGSGPWAACINLMDAHFPYEPTEEYNQWGGEELVALHQNLDGPPVTEFISGRPWWQLEAFEHLYDGTILQLDSYVEKIISFLKNIDEHDDTLVVITSDHGEGFGEVSRLTNRTKMVTHSWGIHEVLTHVPLVVKYPDQNSSQVISQPASLVAFPKTVRAAVERGTDYDSFVPEGPVITFTTRLRQGDDELFDDSKENADDYYGPWRAVYTQAGKTLYKYIERRGDYTSVCLNQNDEEMEGKKIKKKIEEASSSVREKENVKKKEASDTVPEVEQRLSELGYL
ncbi:sulfatase-like hydrolase/transferase [Salinirussus salinus]|uniref:sulfatase-like hydrolase/transferase n=1 Tax=Salinirussus salinus TaxID=1198300 RepID=UPI00135C8D63|nr:sulfatase-like hydrolase/transferase [Salinirussus salinus]